MTDTYHTTYHTYRTSKSIVPALITIYFTKITKPMPLTTCKVITLTLTTTTITITSLSLIAMHMIVLMCYVLALSTLPLHVCHLFRTTCNWVMHVILFAVYSPPWSNILLYVNNSLRYSQLKQVCKVKYYTKLLIFI